MSRRGLAALAVVAALTPASARAQGPGGSVSIQGDLLPAVRGDDGAARRVSELRARVVFEDRLDVGPHLRLTASMFAEGLVADRGTGGTSRDAILRPQELHAELSWAKADVRVGFSRIVWGRLDEFQPTDVVNPQDLSRFFFEGRGEGRLPVALVRARWLPSDRYTLEGVLVPFFRAGRFDQLDEPSSPFDLEPRQACGLGPAGGCVPVAIERHEPGRRWANVQGGGRFSATSGRVDWSASVYRGLEPLPLYTLAVPSAGAPAAVALDARHPRFTMIGGDVETVRGEWGIRGEVAAFPQRALQAGSDPVVAAGRAVEAGAGVDRRAGAYRLSGDVILTRQWAIDGLSAADRTAVMLVAAADRGFARDTRRVRLLGVYDPSDGTAFVRAVGEMSLRDNLSLEASGGLFAGDGLGPLGRLASRDFVYLRLKVFY